MIDLGVCVWRCDECGRTIFVSRVATNTPNTKCTHGGVELEMTYQAGVFEFVSGSSALELRPRVKTVVEI